MQSPPLPRFVRVPPARGFDQHLTHGARGNPFEVQRRRRAELAARRPASPRLVDERRRAEAGVAIVAPDARGQAAQFFVGETEQIVQGVAIDDRRHTAPIRLRLGGLSLDMTAGS